MQQRHSMFARVSECPFAVAHTKFQQGEVGVELLKRLSSDSVGTRLQRFRAVARASSIYNGRLCGKITAFTWNPHIKDYLAFGTKFGDVFLSKWYQGELITITKGSQRNGLIAGICFDPLVDSSMLILPSEGDLIRWDFENAASEVLLNSVVEDDEFASIAVSSHHSGLIAVGDSRGNLTLLDRRSRGKPVWKRKIHNGKVKTVEFSKSCQGLIATVSTDRSANIWDVRMLAQGYTIKALNSFTHRRQVASALFSKSNSNSVMTTDGDSVIRVFSISTSNLIASTAPFDQSRYFETRPVIATWHPLTDLIVTGRFLNGPPSHIVLKFWNPNSKPGSAVKILRENRLWDEGECRRIQINEFSPDGESLAAISEQSFYLLRHDDYEDEV